MSSKKPNSLIPGIMLVAGTAIGAGMFSIPIVSSGMWFSWSMLCLLAVWYVHYLAAMYLYEVNVRFDPGASFDTIVKNVLGPLWNNLTGISIAFLLYILLYAYYSAFGNIVSHTLDIDVDGNMWSQGALSLGFGLLLAAIVWKSTAAVGRISTILVVGMILSFLISMSGFGLNIDAANLFDTNAGSASYHSYIWAAIPYLMTSFGFATVVPSLYKFYEYDNKKIKTSIFYGSLAPLIVYVLFIVVIFGNISRDGFIPINAAGGNMGDLVGALEQQTTSQWTNSALNIFSNFAIITSFLGVGLALFDYISDKFKFGETISGRFKSALIAFLPPGIASFFFPNGFIAAIGFAGLVVVFGYFIVPYLLVKKTRRSQNPGPFRVAGGNLLLTAFLLFSLLAGGCHILAMVGFLAKW